jgi:signal transduction histidine kinase
VTLCVPPLHARSAELPDLAPHLISILCRRRGTAAPDLTPAALDWLVTQAWPGDVAELETTLGRALLRAGTTAIDRHHFTDAAPPPLGDSRQVQLEFLVAQLAHELRNPLTAMKTFAQLPGLADDPALRARFAALTDDSIARMDGLLEHAATFARLGTPAPADVELGPLLDGLVGEMRPALAERAIALEYASPNGARCTVDRAQLAYAVRSVLDGVARDVRADDAVRIDAARPGVVRIEFDDRHGTTDRLRRAVVDGADASGSLPLAFALARAVLERNGGGLALATQPDGRAVLELHLPGYSTRGG